MDQQGAGGTRLPAGARRRQPWQSQAGSPQYGESQYGSPEDTQYEPAPGVYGEGQYGGPAGTGPAPTYGPPTHGPPTHGSPTHGPRPGSGPMPAPDGYRPGAAPTGAYATGAYATGGRYAGGPGSSAQPALGADSGAQPVLGQGSGAQPVLGPGSGPARGFPPRGAQQEHAADSWYTPVGGYAPAPPSSGGQAPTGTGSYARPQAGTYAPARTGGFAPPGTGAYAQPGAGGHGPTGTGSYAQQAPDGYPPAPADDYAPVAPVADDEPMAADPATDPAADDWSDRAPGRRLLRRPVVIGLVAVIVLAGLGAGYKFVYQPRHETATVENALKLPAASASTGSPSKKLGFEHIATRKLDPVPVTNDELFPPAFTLEGNEYLKATSNLTKTCGNAVFGELIQEALQEGDCNQVLRASYVSGNGKMMGTIGVANVSSAYWAEQAAKTVGSTELIAPLTAAKGPTKNLVAGTGLAFAEVKGHYLIMLYGEFTNTKTPRTAAEKQELVAFCDGMFSGSADIPLSRRMLYGKS
jgi:hypothetical protein